MIQKNTSMQHYPNLRKNDTEQNKEYLIKSTTEKNGWMKKNKIPTNKLT